MIFVKMARLPSNLRQTADRIYNGYLHLRLNMPDAHNKVIVLVEGKDDVPFYSKFFKSDNVLVAPCFGCRFVPQIQAYLKKSKKLHHCLAIIDSDFSNLTGREDYEVDHFYTQYHDVEMGLIAVAKVFENAMRPEGITAVSFQQRTAILQELRYLSFARYFNMARHQSLTDEGTGLDLRTLPTAELSTGESISKFFRPTKPQRVKAFNIKSFVRFVNDNSNAEPLQITNGHDFLNRWSYRLNRDGHRVFEEEELREALVNAYKECYIMQNNLYKALKQYAKQYHLDIMTC